MINIQGQLQSPSPHLLNRGLLYGDAVFETLIYHKGSFPFFEDHYFRLMAGMRMMRMPIPDYFTMSFWEEEILKVFQDNDKESTMRCRTTICRTAEGKYTPKVDNQNILYFIEVERISNFRQKFADYTVDVYTDFYASTDALNTIKTNNKGLYVVAGIWAKENNLHNALILNKDKKIVEAVGSNVFLVTEDHKIITPPIEDGCLRGVYRKNLLKVLPKQGYTIEERSINPFELQKAKELFLTNVVQGIQPIHQYRNSNFKAEYSIEIQAVMDAMD